MSTPIYDFLKKYSSADMARLHMPGHKGVGRLGCEGIDITEVCGADVLYSAEGIILESENNLTKIYDTEHSFYSTQGSTLAIFAMLALVSEGNVRGKILAARNVHRSFVSGAALLDLRVDFIYPEGGSHLCECPLNAEDVERALAGANDACAVYITSPDYLGNIADVGGIAKVCKSYGVPLLVDNAHGAYLKLLPEDIHPITLGAAMCSDSAHKTLPALTGGAYLHVSKDYPGYAEGARRALSLFASTSPSYLTLASLDLCNAEISSEEFSRNLRVTLARVGDTKEMLCTMGYTVTESEPLKIVIDAAKSGYFGNDMADFLRERGVECEFSDGEFLVLMPGAKSCEEDLSRLTEGLSAYAEKTEKRMIPPPPRPTPHERVMSIRDAVFARQITLSPEDAVGRVCASLTVSCPPAVPIAVSGERITEKDAELFKYYGIEKIAVVV